MGITGLKVVKLRSCYTINIVKSILNPQVTSTQFGLVSNNFFTIVEPVYDLFA